MGVVVAGLPRRIKLLHASGLIAGGQKWMRLNLGADNILDPGESVVVSLSFSKPFLPRRLRVLAGAFA
jgi:hypothetical protein